MGNQIKKQNQEFGKNFDFAEHQRKMSQLNQNYMQHNLAYQRDGTTRINAPKQQSCQQLQRKNAIFKPSIDIGITVHEVSISLEYKSQLGCQLYIYLGVNNINQDPNKKNTTEIQADFKFSELLPAGNKLSFKKTYPTHHKELMNKQLILRIQGNTEATEISLRRLKKQQNWKIILEKLQINGKVFQLENIYGGGGGQECIVCMCDPSDTLIRPCNHVCLCKQCAKGIIQKTNKCPICRQQINQLVTIKSSLQ